jgi:chaperonin GroEL
MPPSSKRSTSRRVIFQPAVYRALQRGIGQVVGAVRPTLGPQARGVAIDVLEYTESGPVFFDDGGEIARHIVALPDGNVDMGAKLVRDLLWRLQRQLGDGTATAAVILQAVFDQGVRYLASGGNAMRLRHHLESGMRLVLSELTAASQPIEGAEALAGLAETLCYDAPMAKLLGEVFDIVGEFGRLEIRQAHGRGVEREYVEGMYWERGLVTRLLNPDPDRVKAELEDAAILISDLPLEEPEQLYPVLELCLHAKIPALLIVADKVSDRVLGLLQTNRDPDRFQVIAVHTPGYGEQARAAALTDLAVLTGGRSFLAVIGDTLDGIALEDLGRARRVWADPINFGIVGGKGDPKAVRRHIAALRGAHEAARLAPDREQLRERIGKLLGGSATLWVGGITERDVEDRVARAKRAAATVRAAMIHGVLPGGGVALLACRPALQERLDNAGSSEEVAAYRALIRAMEEPFRCIVANAGSDDRDALAQVRLSGPGFGFDVKHRQVVDMAAAGIVDATTVVKSAVYGAISTAALALTVDALIHRRKDEHEVTVPEPAAVKEL